MISYLAVKTVLQSLLMQQHKSCESVTGYYNDINFLKSANCFTIHFSDIERNIDNLLYLRFQLYTAKLAGLLSVCNVFV